MEKKEDIDNNETDSKEDIIEEDESELEEELKIPNIDEEKFRDIFVNINSRSPSLEQVAIMPEPIHDLEEDLSKEPEPEKEDKNISYDISYEEKQERSYEENPTIPSEHFKVNPSLEMARQDPREMFETNRQMDFHVNPQFEDKSIHKDYSVNLANEDLEKNKTHDPFQRQKRKDEFYKFR